MSRAASIAGFEDPLGDDNDCGICLESELDVAVSGCKHKLCIDCAIRCCSAAAVCSWPGGLEESSFCLAPPLAAHRTVC